MAVYLVKSPQDKNGRLVEARTAKSAVNHVVANTVTAEVVPMKELVKYVNAGQKIETLDDADEKAAA